MTPQSPNLLPVRPWRLLAALSVSGFLLALPGGLLPLWGYHLRPAFSIASLYFLALGGGLSFGSLVAFRLRTWHGYPRLLTTGGFLGAVALLLLSVSQPPAALWFQLLALAVSGVAAAFINAAVFGLVEGVWARNPARVTLTAGAFFSAGSAASAWILSECIDLGQPSRLLSLTALLPAAAAVAWARLPLKDLTAHLPAPESPDKDLRTVLAFLFALLLFFQFACEWSIAGWLPVYLVDRMGMSPAGAVRLLFLYWIALMLGRIVAVALLPRIRHSRMLAFSAFSAVFGNLALFGSGTRGGVVVGILFVGAGFSGIYPLAAERIAARFSSYHAGHFNGVFTFALLGGVMAPAILGNAAGLWGLGVMPWVEIAGSCAVFVMILLLWLGWKVSGS
ncbi:MAG: major facilitator superfamily 1 [Bryobacterales bacterium]|nr:major facilitator superfamily 1 [Bryobacterales bacterium]